MTRILGFDPGLSCMGFGVLDVDNDTGQIDLQHFGFFEIKRNGKAFNDYLNDAIAGLTENFPRLIQAYDPNVVCAEIVPVGRLGSNTELVVAGITTIKVVSFQFGLHWMDLAANTVKKTVSGNGRATKAQVRKSLFEIFPTLKTKNDALKKEQKSKGERASGLPADVYDGIAVAYTAAIKLGGKIETDIEGTESIEAIAED